MSLWKSLVGRFGSGANDYDEVRIDASTNSLMVIDSAHHEIHEGDHYKIRGYEALAKGGDKQFLFLTPDTTEWAHMIIGVDNTLSTIIVKLYEAPTYTLGSATACTKINRNRNSNNTSSISCYEDPTVSATGTLLGQNIFGSGKNSTGGGDRDTNEIVLKQGTAYLLDITEINITETNINWLFDWYEHTNKN